MPKKMTIDQINLDRNRPKAGVTNTYPLQTDEHKVRPVEPRLSMERPHVARSKSVCFACSHQIEKQQNIYWVPQTPLVRHHNCEVTDNYQDAIIDWNDYVRAEKARVEDENLMKAYEIVLRAAAKDDALGHRIRQTLIPGLIRVERRYSSGPALKALPTPEEAKRRADIEEQGVSRLV